VVLSYYSLMFYFLFFTIAVGFFPTVVVQRGQNFGRKIQNGRKNSVGPQNIAAEF
jgi:hypothetical protein